MSLPFVWIVLCFISGIILSKYLHPTLFLIYLIAFISASFLVVYPVKSPGTSLSGISPFLVKLFNSVNKRKRLLFLLLIGLAGAIAYRSSLFYSPQNIANLSPNSDIRIIARVVKPPIERPKKTVLILRVEEFVRSETSDTSDRTSERKVNGLVKATIRRPLQSYHYGDRLLLKGRLYRPYNFGEFDYKRYLATRRIYCLFSTRGKDVQLLSREGNLLFSTLFYLRRLLANIIDKNLSRISFLEGAILKKEVARDSSSPEASLLKAILLGERFNISPQLKRLFINTGTIHILSISGLHIGIIATIFLLFFKFLRLPYRVYYLLTIVFIVLYAILSGARVPVVRATILTVIILAARLLNRPSSIYNSLGFAAFLILVAQPLYLFDPGFQLSFLCVFFVIYLTPKIERILYSKEANLSEVSLRTRRFRRVKRFIITSFSASLAVWLGIFPLISYYFKNFVPITVLANLVIVPLLFLIVADGFLLILSAAIPILSAIFAVIEGFLLVFLIKTATFFSRLPFSHFHFSLTLLGVVTYYFLLFGLLNYGLLKKIKSGKISET
ncbi:MAG: ComEC family competence protein [Candidatus Omnitrophica bacterium]|nr:ComEC family competence protein [Candidatus Omnitrophota bacterium]